MTEREGWSAGQRLAGDQLRALVDTDPRAVSVISAELVEADGPVRFDISLDLTALPHAPGGIKVHPRERFIVSVPSGFPFKVPTVATRHSRWATAPHVQWGRQLCLYAAPSTEWAPEDGMRGYVDRLRLWLQKAALGELDPVGQPLHPPANYGRSSAGTIVVRADLGELVPWSSQESTPVAKLVALCRQVGERLDVMRWMRFDVYRAKLVLGDPPLDPDGAPYVAAPAVILNSHLGFEYPSSAKALMAGLSEAGVTDTELLELIAVAGNENYMNRRGRGVDPDIEFSELPHGPGGAPLVLLVGTPARRLATGPHLAHLVAWRIDSSMSQYSSVLPLLNPDAPEDADLRTRVEEASLDWLNKTTIAWARVYEDRPEITVRRDHTSSGAWLRDKSVLVLGCGALGAPAAEACVRAGAKRVTVVDNGVVTPGILVRQPYSDSDIGEYKAIALADRLNAIRPLAVADPNPQDAIEAYLRSTLPPSFDLVIDATADRSVRGALERARAAAPGEWPPVLTLLIGYQARRGVVAVSRTGASGGGYDILRRFGIAVRSTHADAFADLADDLYPDPPRNEVFLPEPGCSEPTFVGSAAEAAALAGSLLTTGLDAVAGNGPPASALPMSVAAVRLDAPDAKERPGRNTGKWLGWDNDTVVPGADGTLPVRFSTSAASTVWTEARRTARLHGPDVETGGMLLGQIDEAVGAVFIDVATPPTPTSRTSTIYFEHGPEGSEEVVRHHLRRSGGATGFVGMWHTHPNGPERPSDIDRTSMENLVAPVAGGAGRCLIMIFAGAPAVWKAWREQVRSTSPGVPAVYARLVRRADRTGPAPESMPAPDADYFPAGWTPASTTRRARRRWWTRHRQPRR